MKIKKMIWTAVVSLTALGSFMLIKRMWLDPKSDMMSSERPAKMVECIRAQKGSISRKKNFSGTLKSSDSVSLVSEAHGRIEKINCSQGAFVKKDQVLFQLDSTRAVAEVQEAKANLNAAKMAFVRQKALFQKNATSKSALEETANKFVGAQARLSSADSALKATRIMAPFDGQIGLFSLSVGTHVSPNEELARLISSGPLVVEFQVPESEKQYITVGQELDVLSEMLDSLPVSAKVTAFDPYSDPITHTARVKGTVSQEESLKLRDGAFANVGIVLGEAHDAIIVPQEAIAHEGDFDFAYIMLNGRAKKVNVSLGYNDGTHVQIEEGVLEGQYVIVDPVEELYDNMPVRTTTASEGAPK